MNRTLLCLVTLVLLANAGDICSAQLRITGRFPVSQASVEEAIVRVLLHQEVPPAGLHVQMLTDAVMSAPSAQFDVLSILPLRPSARSARATREFAVRLGCRGSGVCLPFYTIATLPIDIQIPEWTHPIRSNPIWRIQTSLKPSTVLHRGARATLVFSDGASQVEIAVVSLQDAGVGDVVQVTSLDRKHTYKANAVSPTLLRGEF